MKFHFQDFLEALDLRFYLSFVKEKNDAQYNTLSSEVLEPTFRNNLEVQKINNKNKKIMVTYSYELGLTLMAKKPPDTTLSALYT